MGAVKGSGGGGGGGGQWGVVEAVEGSGVVEAVEGSGGQREEVEGSGKR